MNMGDKRTSISFPFVRDPLNIASLSTTQPPRVILRSTSSVTSWTTISRCINATPIEQIYNIGIRTMTVTRGWTEWVDTVFGDKKSSQFRRFPIRYCRSTIDCGKYIHALILSAAFSKESDAIACTSPFKESDAKACTSWSASPERYLELWKRWSDVIIRKPSAMLLLFLPSTSR